MSTIWEAYPWRFGGGFCIVKSFISEMTAYASVLTIMAFTIDRYVAICHPLKAQSISSLARAVRIIVIAWMLACGCALPYPVHTRLLYEVQDPCTKKVGTAGSLINSLIDLMNGLAVRLRDWWNLFAGCMHCGWPSLSYCRLIDSFSCVEDGIQMIVWNDCLVVRMSWIATVTVLLQYPFCLFRSKCQLNVLINITINILHW